MSSLDPDASRAAAAFEFHAARAQSLPSTASAHPSSPATGSTKPPPKPAEETTMLAGEAEKTTENPDTSGIVPIARNPRKFLVAVDPVAKHGQSEKAVALTRDVAKAGDTVILVSVVDELYMSDSATVSMGYASEYAGHVALEEQVQVMNYQARILEDIGKTFERGVKIITKVIYGAVEKSLINIADEYLRKMAIPFSGLWLLSHTNDLLVLTVLLVLPQRVDLIVIGKRKLGRMEKLLTTVLVAK